MTKENHHHGNLRVALITASVDLLQEGGIDGLTLRRAAARAGVSHAAPAHHFNGLPGLMTATAAQAFQMFTAAMVLARDAAPPTPRARLLGVANGYLAFARGHAGLFQLMFNAPNLCRDDPELALASAAAYGVLRDACAPFAAPNPERLELAVWSLVHGFAALDPAPTDIAALYGHPAPDFADLLWPVVDAMQGPQNP